MKHCWKCKQIKNDGDFYKDRSKAGGLSGTCKLCQREENKRWASSEHGKEHKRYYKQTITGILQTAKANARTSGLEFSITKKDICSIPSICPVLGVPLFFTKGKRTANTPSLDRIDNSKGYIPGNVQIISWRANLLKANGSLEEFKKIVEYMKPKIFSMDISKETQLLNWEYEI